MTILFLLQCCEIFKQKTTAPAKVLGYVNAVFYSNFSEMNSLTENWTKASTDDTIESLARFAIDGKWVE